ncbi:MAG: proteasome accessory factor PafA2 family protein, partial [Planctomycetales bacterium]
MTKQSCRLAASKPRILDRLVGLETEYAVRFHPEDGARRIPHEQLYRLLLDELGRQVPTVEANHFKEGVFTANGGAVWFERVRQAPFSGLIEGSTPECRGPRQIQLYQRAQDQMLGDAARRAVDLGEFTLLKNDRDALDNIYGAQENYEARLGGPLSLIVWRIGLILLTPAMLFSWIGFLLIVAGVVGYLFTAGLIYLLFKGLFPKTPDGTSSLSVALFGTGEAVPDWMEVVCLWLMRVVVAPLAMGLWALTGAAAFVRIRRQLLPFLISRSVIGGAGSLDRENHFHLADKAAAVNCLIGYGGLIDDRPLFNFGHFFKAMFLQAWCSPRDYLHLFASRQRLQIGLGDSNMAEEAEYLRVGTTLLVLDVIESGAMPSVPQPRRPLRALRFLCGDPSLKASVEVSGDKQWTALQIQRFYWNACRKFIAASDDAPAEAIELLERWDQALGDLENLDDGAERLIGRIDWVTKKYFLDQAGADADWESRKKIDLRYHELSPEGYFVRLKETGLVATMTEPEELDRAIRNPPPGTLATTRGHYIREFSQGSQRLRANWH